MYSLEINFLKDREIRPVAAGAGRAAAPVGDRTPLYIGLAVAIASLGLVGGYFAFLQYQIQQLAARNQQLDADVAALTAQLADIETTQQQIELVRLENAAFANVFNEIRPWSALLQELRDRTPARVQITTVNQTAGTTPTDDPEAEPLPAGGLSITGVACSFNDINDFMLTLKQSPLLDSATVLISQAEKREELLDPEVDGACPGSPPNTPDFLVDFTIDANLTTTPATQLLEVLDRQGAVGLATRIRALRDSGVIEGQ